MFVNFRLFVVVLVGCLFVFLPFFISLFFSFSVVVVVVVVAFLHFLFVCFVVVLYYVSD